MMLGTNIVSYVFRNVEYIFPSAHGAAGAALTNDGSGNLGWWTISGIGGGAATPHVWTNDNGTLKPVDFPTNILLRVNVPELDASRD